MNLGLLDIIIFFGYFLGIVAFAITIAARSKTQSASDYFLASKKLPWYVVGASFIASNISTEHFIGMVGWGFLYGMAVSNWEWGNAITLTALIWIFLPFYMRGNVSTMPEFLERRYNKKCRYIYAGVMIIGLVIAMLGGVLFAGAKAINVFFPMITLPWGVALLALTAGAYTIYGGLLSAVWADFVQYCLLMVGGLVVTIFGLYHVGGLDQLILNLPEKFIVFYPPTHELIPWSGLLMGMFSVGIWYSCANQFMVQRCLAARTEWDAQMGVVMAGFTKAILPFIIVVPGIIAFHLFQDRLSDGDQAWPFMVKEFLPVGFTGLVLAGLASAIMSTLSAITNSSSTIFTLDLYKELFRPEASDKELHRVGRLSGTVILLIGVGVALLLSQLPGITVFGIIQQTFFYMAAPIASCFLIGVLWKRATGPGALAAIILGFCVYTPLVKFVIFPQVDCLVPYDTFTHHTFLVLLLSGLTLVIVSLFTPRKTDEELKGVIWSFQAIRQSAEDKKKNGGLRSLRLWWSLMVGLIVMACVATTKIGSSTQVIEAEDTPYQITAGSLAETQARGTHDDFNMWTGSGQVLFTPKKSGDRIDFFMPVEKSSQYLVDMIITRGPEYGPFSIEINGQSVPISFPETTKEGQKYQVNYQTADVYPGNSVPSSRSKLPEGEWISGDHLVHRLRLGSFELTPESAQLAIIAAENPGVIGIDQIILTKTKAE
ncbi:sodium/solute symporter [Puniceicoccaceae bacterium]|nr:sodium/solute symporter [Puniceicoccaceae bacterium]